MDELVIVAPGHVLAQAAAASLQRALRDGAPFAVLSSSTRSLARQQELFDHQGEPGWPALAAHPAKSKHVWRPDDPRDHGGRAIDVNDPLRDWLVALGAQYGWVRTIASEPWHFEHSIELDRRIDDPVQPPPEAEEDDMRGLIEALYRFGLGREGSTPDVDAWVITAAAQEMTAKQLMETFMSSLAEPGTVRRAYRDFLRREPSAADIAAWTRGFTIAEVRDGVAASEEAQH